MDSTHSAVCHHVDGARSDPVSVHADFCLRHGLTVGDRRYNLPLGIHNSLHAGIDSSPVFQSFDSCRLLRIVSARLICMCFPVQVAKLHLLCSNLIPGS